MALQICGGNAFFHTNIETPTSVAEPKAQPAVSASPASVARTALSLFKQNAFQHTEETDEPADENNEYVISYHKLSEHECPRQVLRDINCKTGGQFTQADIDGICENLGRYFDIHYILHGGILIDYRFYDAFGDYITSELLTEGDRCFTQWQMHVFDNEDTMYEYGLDDQMITACQDMIHHHCKDLI